MRLRRRVCVILESTARRHYEIGEGYRHLLSNAVAAELSGAFEPMEKGTEVATRDAIEDIVYLGEDAVRPLLWALQAEVWAKSVASVIIGALRRLLTKAHVATVIAAWRAARPPERDRLMKLVRALAVSRKSVWARVLAELEPDRERGS